MRHHFLTALLLALAPLPPAAGRFRPRPIARPSPRSRTLSTKRSPRATRDAVMALLAPDAEILEMGIRENRSEYAAQHLAADIEFAQAVASIRGALIVRQEGNVAWTSLTSRSTGTFRGRAVDSENAELMVLAKNGERWQIRAIHWSGHPHRVTE